MSTANEAATPQKPTAVQVQVHMLHDRLADLRQQINDLKDALAPILTPLPLSAPAIPQTGPGPQVSFEPQKVPPTISPLTADIAGHVKTVACLVEIVDEIRKRLEV